MQAINPSHIRPESYAMELQIVEPGNQSDIKICSMITRDSDLRTDITVPWILNCSSHIQTKKIFLCMILAVNLECYVPVSSVIELSETSIL